MAKIQNVNYEAIPAQAKEMRSCGKQLNSEMTKVYSNVETMHNSWYGDRYNELVKAFNNMIPSLNEMLELVVKEIPFTLETIANNYSRADRAQNVTVASDEEPRKLTNLAIINDVGMRFLTSAVQECQQQISASFENAKDQMNKIETIYSRVQWESEAAEVFKSKFTKLKNNIVASFEGVNDEFKKLMQQTQQDIQNAENANTVK